MREIKFRAWDKKEKLMLQDIQTMYDGSCNHKETEERYGWISCFDSFINNDNYVVMQYTGLKDKNGTEIYEGDICNCREYECFGKVEWNNEEAGFYFCVAMEGGGFEEEHLYDYVDELEVIGNIYDNPELLGGGSMLSDFTTRELVEELAKREGVEEIVLDPYEVISVGNRAVGGPARILIVTD